MGKIIIKIASKVEKPSKKRKTTKIGNNEEWSGDDRVVGSRPENRFLEPPPFLLFLGWILSLVAFDVIKPNLETTLQKEKKSLSKQLISSILLYQESYFTSMTELNMDLSTEKLGLYITSCVFLRLVSNI